ncbi:MAG: hypothetical protein AAGG46_06360 [Planctomycetota bacterium]
MLISKWMNPEAARGFIFSCGYGSAMSLVGVCWLACQGTKQQKKSRLFGWIAATNLLFWGGLSFASGDYPFAVQLPALFCWLSSFYTGGLVAIVAARDLTKPATKACDAEV